MQLAQSIADLRYGGFPMNPDPNAFRNDAEQQMGLLAFDAFHRKDVGALKQLMDQGAPAGARLDCALSIRLEADFVAALKVILGGDRATDAPLEKIQQAFDYTPETAAAIQTYTRDAFVIRDILCAAENQASIPLAPEFIEHMLNNAAGFRDSLGNSSLMTATCMIDQHAVPVNKFIVKLLQRGIAVDQRLHDGRAEFVVRPVLGLVLKPRPDVRAEVVDGLVLLVDHARELVIKLGQLFDSDRRDVDGVVYGPAPILLVRIILGVGQAEGAGVAGARARERFGKLFQHAFASWPRTYAAPLSSGIQWGLRRQRLLPSRRCAFFGG